ncbi:MAG: glycosyltransferase family A protein [Oscillospiraceae bacterium]
MITELYGSIFDEISDQAEIAVFTSGILDAAARAALESAMSAAGKSGGGFVLRTYPRELGFYVDPITLDAVCAHNFAFAVSVEALRSIGGVDCSMGAAAATDVIRRLRCAGFATSYLPSACVRGEFEGETYAELLYGTLALRLRYGRVADVWNAKIMWLKALKCPNGYNTTRSELRSSLKRRMSCLFSIFFERFGSGKKFKCTLTHEQVACLGFERGDYTSEELPQFSETPRVSLITRTRNRPETLRKTLESLRHQTYKNLEIVVIEDGEPLCERMLKRDFADLEISYEATVENVGRAAAANRGFKRASGEYLNLLDDDDYLLPEHVELGVRAARTSGADIVFMRGVALETDKKSDAPYEFEIKGKQLLNFPRVDAFTMVRRCVTTQNGVLFKKSLCESVGGMREELGAHEDWNLWLRLMAQGKSITLPYVTCCYIVPADAEVERARLAQYSKFDGELLADDVLVYYLSADEIAQAYRSVIRDYMYLFTLDRALEHLAAEYPKAAEFWRRADKRRFDSRTSWMAIITSSRGFNCVSFTKTLSANLKKNAKKTSCAILSRRSTAR